jgi:hypothetical protein
VLESDDLQIDYSKLKFSDSVSLKKYNEFGRPMDDGYDYSRHKLRSDSEGGQVRCKSQTIFVLFASKFFFLLISIT